MQFYHPLPNQEGVNWLTVGGAPLEEAGLGCLLISKMPIPLVAGKLIISWIIHEDQRRRC